MTSPLLELSDKSRLVQVGEQPKVQMTLMDLLHDILTAYEGRCWSQPKSELSILGQNNRAFVVTISESRGVETSSGHV
jgi:hypothetical protein